MNSNNEIKYMIDLVRNLNESIESGKFMINERNPLGTAAKEGKFGAKQLQPIFDDLIKQGSSTEALLKRIKVKDSDDLFKLVTNDFVKVDTKLGALSKAEASSLRANFELSILKNKSGVNKELLDIAASNLVKDNRFINNYKQYGREADLVDALKKKGYSDQGANAIAKARSNTKINAPKPNKTTSGGNTNLTSTKKIPDETKNKIKEYLKFKPNWNKLVKWGAGLGLSAAVLWYFLESNKSDETITPPVDTPPSPPVDNGGSGNTGGGGGGSSWQECPTLEQVSGGTASIDYGMSCDLVGEIQLKLDEKIKAGLEVLYKGKKLSGLKNDTKFGGRTKASVMAFQKQNGKTETGSVNKETYDLLFGTSTPNVTPAPPVKLDPRDEVDTTSDEVSDESGI
jgi:hypothetical protein